MPLDPPLEAFRERLYTERPSAEARTLAQQAVHVADAHDLFTYVRSQHFRQDVFERVPTLIRLGSGQAPMDPLSIDHVLDVEWTYEGEYHMGSNWRDGYEWRDGQWQCKEQPNASATANEKIRSKVRQLVSDAVPYSLSLVHGSFCEYHPRFQPNSTISRDEVEQALREGYTAVSNSVQHFLPPVAKLCGRFSAATERMANANLYLSAPSPGDTTMAPHNDRQCTFIVQLHGRKRWRMWVAESLLCEVLVFGKAPDTQLDEERLGPPILEVVLEPSDVLYVPRGCIHATATEPPPGCRSDSDQVSMHLTVGIEALPGFTYEAALGSMEWVDGSANHGHLIPCMQQAIGKLSLEDVRFRSSITLGALEDGGNNDAESEASGAGNRDDAGASGPGERSRGEEEREKVRALLHAAVDEMIDNTPFLDQLHSDLRHLLTEWRMAAA